ncbi:hypothetical protein [Enterobacter kobei]|uniref:hypothetical protein n=1 Tax=Enterobacter kobei TaxID=208224 RepID=UPI003CEE35B7
MSEAHKVSERWTIDINNGRFIFCREVNGKPAGSYCPVGKDLAAIYAIAILNGFEPPRHLKEIDGDFIERQVRHLCSDCQPRRDQPCQGKRTD